MSSVVGAAQSVFASFRRGKVGVRSEWENADRWCTKNMKRTALEFRISFHESGCGDGPLRIQFSDRG